MDTPELDQSASAATTFDPLLRCIEALCHLEERNFSSRTILAGLPLVDGMLTPSLFVRAVEKLGFGATVQHRTLKGLEPENCPLVLILKDNKACLIENTDGDMATVYFPDAPETPQQVSLAELKQQHTGYSVALDVRPELDERTADFEPEKPSWFWSTLKKFRPIYGHALVVTFLINLFVFIIPLFIMNVYDRVIPNNATTTLWALSIGAIVFLTFDFLLRMLRGYLLNLAGSKADSILSDRLFEHVVSLKMVNKPASSGAFINYFKDFEALRAFISSAALTGLIDMPFIVLYLFFIWYIGGLLVIIPLIAVILALVIAYILEKPVKNAAQNEVLSSAHKQAVLFETIQGLESIKALSAEGRMLKKWRLATAVGGRGADQRQFYNLFASNYVTLIQAVGIISLVIYGVYLIIQGNLSVGGLLACSIIAGRAMMINQISAVLFRWERTRAAFRGLNKLMALEVERPEGKRLFRKEEIKGNYVLQEVDFAYPRQQIAALKNIQIKFSQGEKVAIIGPVGSGKTTLLKLLVGFYQPLKGAVSLDGTDLADLDPVDVRHHVHYVSQDSMLFFGTVRDNIAMGDSQATDEDILQAATVAGVDDFVHRHPAGYDLQVGERGEALSTGQRQAVALARALVSKPSVLLLDEPTSNIDPQTEQQLVARLRQATKDMTLIVVTHRPAMLALVDRTVVIDSGVITADGPRDKIIELLKGASSAAQA